MRILIERTRTELLIATFVIPTLAGIISRIINFNMVDWNSVALIIVTLWWLSSAINLNKKKDKFDLTLSKIAGTIMIVILIVDLVAMDINGIGTDRTAIVTILNILFPFCGFYIVYILTRIHGSTVNDHDPSGLEIFPNFIFFILYPIGIWKFQSEITEAIKT